MSGRESERDAALPGVGPTLPPRLKAAVTRARSSWWLVRSRGRADAEALRILFYHRVSDDDDPLAVAPRRFDQQMALVADGGYSVIDLAEAADRLRTGAPLRRTIVLNFDDGYRDVGENALPVLERHGFHATVFVPPAAIDGTVSFGWYREPPPLLDWEEIVELDRAGTLRFEAHSLTHPNLLALDDDSARREIGGSKSALEARLGRAVEGFCYPAGLFGGRERRLVEEAGFRIGVSCEPGVNRPGTDLLALRRRQIDGSDNLLDFRAKLGGGHDSPLPLRGLYRRARYGEPKPVAASGGLAASP